MDALTDAECFALLVRLRISLTWRGGVWEAFAAGDEGGAYRVEDEDARRAVRMCALLAMGQAHRRCE